MLELVKKISKILNSKKVIDEFHKRWTRLQKKYNTIFKALIYYKNSLTCSSNQVLFEVGKILSIRICFTVKKKSRKCVFYFQNKCLTVK